MKHVCLQGCYELVTSFLESNMGVIAGVTFGIAFSQVLKTQRAQIAEHKEELKDGVSPADRNVSGLLFVSRHQHQPVRDGLTGKPVMMQEV